MGCGVAPPRLCTVPVRKTVTGSRIFSARRAISSASPPISPSSPTWATRPPWVMVQTRVSTRGLLLVVGGGGGAVAVLVVEVGQQRLVVEGARLAEHLGDGLDVLDRPLQRGGHLHRGGVAAEAVAHLHLDQLVALRVAH